MLARIVSYHRYTFLEHDLAPPARPVVLAAGLEIAVLAPAQAELITEFNGRAVDSPMTEMFRRDMLAGQVCIAALRDGRVIGCTWLSTKYAYLPGRAYEMGRGWAWGHRTYTHLASRGQGIHQALLIRRNSSLKESGALRCANMTENPVALHNFVKGGCIVTGSCRDVRVLGRWRRLSFTGGVIERIRSRPA